MPDAKETAATALKLDPSLRSPLLYEHFRDKEDLLTQLAVEGQLCLAKNPAKDLPKAPDASVLLMVERYWSFMLKNKQIYRLMNGMEGVPIDREKVDSIAQRSFEAAKSRNPSLVDPGKW